MFFYSYPCFANVGVGTGGYFYGHTDYEGFAGYVTVITPRIKQSSESMTRKLNINSKKAQFKHNYSIQESNTTIAASTQQNFSNVIDNHQKNNSKNLHTGNEFIDIINSL